MTTEKARKRAIRTRMTKTGESYTAARRNLIREAPPAPPSADRQPAMAPDATVAPAPAALEAMPPRLAEPGVSDESMLRATGRSWDDWFRILDERGQEGYSHPATAAWVAREHGIPGWWAQQVTVGFERARGLRKVHQTTDGFEVSVSRTLPHDVHRLWTAFTDDDARARWQRPDVLRGRTSVADKSARFDHSDDGSRVLVTFTPKGDGRTTVTLVHQRLSGPDAIEPMRTFWREQLAALGESLAGP